MNKILLALAITPVATGNFAASAQAVATPTKLVKNGDKYQLMRDGKPYFIKGAGGSGDLAKLKERGGNSNRTWGSDNIQGQLDEAQKLGMTYTVGIWLGHTQHGFNYSDEKMVAKQFEMAKAAIDRYKDHPAVLAWGIGNEMEGFGETTDPKVWAAVQQIAAYAKKVDPNHPTMTVIAEVGGDKVASLHKYCPDIDIVGLNTYAGAPSIPERYAKAGGSKPYILTEFGPPGTWEVGKNTWGAVIEPTSTAKAESYANSWNKAIKDQPLALGGYAFTWGNKQEATATWFGMLLPTGEMLGAADAMTELWTGKKPAQQVPQIKDYKLETPGVTGPGATAKAFLVTTDPDNDPIKVEYILQYDPVSYGVGGYAEAVPPVFPDAIVKADSNSVEVKMPPYSGAYRLFAYARDGKGGAAVANLPLKVEGGTEAPPPASRKANLPLELLPENGDLPYIPSGYMGNTGAISMDSSTETPRVGKSCLKVTYNEGGNWGGVVWQSPANDWGSQPGGFNLTGAKKLTFWARGAKGGEIVSFGYGIIGKDKKYHDTGRSTLDRTQLSTEWKQFQFDLTGQDLSHIKSGFYWSLGGTGQPITFYLDDIRYE